MPDIAMGYANNPCTICREEFVQWMIDTKTLTDEIATECVYDADEKNASCYRHGSIVVRDSFVGTALLQDKGMT